MNKNELVDDSSGSFSQQAAFSIPDGCVNGNHNKMSGISSFDDLLSVVDAPPQLRQAVTERKRSHRRSSVSLALPTTGTPPTRAEEPPVQLFRLIEPPSPSTPRGPRHTHHAPIKHSPALTTQEHTPFGNMTPLTDHRSSSVSSSYMGSVTDPLLLPPDMMRYHGSMTPSNSWSMHDADHPNARSTSSGPVMKHAGSSLSLGGADEYFSSIPRGSMDAPSAVVAAYNSQPGETLKLSSVPFTPSVMGGHVDAGEMPHRRHRQQQLMTFVAEEFDVLCEDDNDDEVVAPTIHVCVATEDCDEDEEPLLTRQPSCHGDSTCRCVATDEAPFPMPSPPSPPRSPLTAFARMHSQSSQGIAFPVTASNTVVAANSFSPMTASCQDEGATARCSAFLMGAVAASHE